MPTALDSVVLVVALMILVLLVRDQRILLLVIVSLLLAQEVDPGPALGGRRSEKDKRLLHCVDAELDALDLVR